MTIIRIYWHTLKHINLRGYIYVWANLLAVVLSLPIITAPAAWAGLVHLSHKAHTQPQVSVEDFWEGFKIHFRHGLLVGVLTAVILVVNVSNLLVFQADTRTAAVFMRLVWVTAIVVWFSMLFYVWVILEEMEKPTLLGALRNAGLMVLQNPFFTLGLWPGILIIAILSTVFFPAWLLLTGSLFAVLSTTATLDRLRVAGHHNPAHQPPSDSILP